MTSAIDSDGALVFLGCHGMTWRCGFYTGPDPAADIVIQEGDALLGSTVRHLCCFGGPFVLALDNQIINNGRIVFSVSLLDGRNFIVRADPVRRRW